MDKVTPKDVFQANLDRLAPLLAKLKADGIGHIIDGRSVPSISGASACERAIPGFSTNTRNDWPTNRRLPIFLGLQRNLWVSFVRVW